MKTRLSARSIHKPLRSLCALILAAACLRAGAAYDNGQAPAVLLGSQSGPQQAVSYVSGLAVDPASGKLFVSAAGFHRVLRFTSEESLKNGGAAEAVLGQPDFTTTEPGAGPAGLKYPEGITCDGDGHLWVADSGNNRVLRFDNAASLPSGSSASGVLGQPDFYSTASGTSQTSMNDPKGVAADAGGRLWVVEQFNSRVLRFNAAATRPNGAPANGVLGQAGFNTKVQAGGQAGMDRPTSVAVDGGYHGEPVTVYVGDRSNGRVLRYYNAPALPATGGLPDAVFGQADLNANSLLTGEGLNLPDGVATDGNGRLWVGDTGNNRVLKYNFARFRLSGFMPDGILGQANEWEKVQGDGPAGLRVPGAVAVNAAGDLFIADTNNGRVVRYADAAGKASGAPADSVIGAAKLSAGPFDYSRGAGMAIDPVSGKLFVAEPDRHRVLRFASSQSLKSGDLPEGVFGQGDFSSELPGLNRYSMNRPQSVAIDAGGHLWVADHNNNRVLRFDNAVTAQPGVQADGVLGQPDFISAQQSNSASGMSAPRALAVDDGGNLWVADRQNHRVLRFPGAAGLGWGAPATRVFGQSGFGQSAPGLAPNRMKFPSGIAIGTTGHLWVADSQNHRVLRFEYAATLASGVNADGVLGQANLNSDAAGLTASGMFNPAAIAAGRNGRLWVCDAGNLRVLRFEAASGLQNGAPASGVFGPAAFNTKDNTPFKSVDGVAEDAKGRVWAGSSYSARIFGFDPVQSAFIKTTGVNAGGRFFMIWSNRAGVSYQIWSSTDLLNFQKQGSGIVGSGSDITFTDLSPLGPRKFYRIEEQ